MCLMSVSGSHDGLSFVLVGSAAVKEEGDGVRRSA